MNKQDIKILIACEYSGVIRDEFIKRGFNAISCDIIETESHGPHYKGNVLDILYDNWTLVIAHHPCTYLSYVANRWYKKEYNLQYDLFDGLVTRHDKRIKAFEFFMKFINNNIPFVCVENPVGIVSKWYRKPDQIIHPYYFGDPYKKRTCLWLRNLPLLKDTNKLPEPKPYYRLKTSNKPIQWVESLGRSENRSKLRSKTFPGIAKAMADQWSKLLIEHLNKQQ